MFVGMKYFSKIKAGKNFKMFCKTLKIFAEEIKPARRNLPVFFFLRLHFGCFKNLLKRDL